MSEHPISFGLSPYMEKNKQITDKERLKRIVSFQPRKGNMLNKAYEDVEKTSDIFEDALRESQRKTVVYPAEVIRHTRYYEVGGIEVIDYIKAKLTPEQYKGYLLGNIYKYSGRCQYKGEYVKDVIKLADYTSWLKEHNESNP